MNLNHGTRSWKCTAKAFVAQVWRVAVVKLNLIIANTYNLPFSLDLYLGTMSCHEYNLRLAWEKLFQQRYEIPLFKFQFTYVCKMFLKGIHVCTSHSFGVIRIGRHVCVSVSWIISFSRVINVKIFFSRYIGIFIHNEVCSYQRIYAKIFQRNQNP